MDSTVSHSRNDYPNAREVACRTHIVLYDLTVKIRAGVFKCACTLYYTVYYTCRSGSRQFKSSAAHIAFARFFSPPPTNIVSYNIIFVYNRLVTAAVLNGGDNNQAKGYL